MAKLKVFVSYAHANHRYLDRLKAQLCVLQNENLISWWFDGKIRPGSEWDDAIRSELKQADIIILLLSNEFFGSRYIKGVEMKEARRRREAGEAEILPVLLEPTGAFAEQTWLKKFQTAPSVNGQLRPINSFAKASDAWNHVQLALRGVIEEMRQRKAGQRASGLISGD